MKTGKKWLTLGLAMAVMLSLCACGGSKNTTDNNANDSAETSANGDTTNDSMAAGENADAVNSADTGANETYTGETTATDETANPTKTLVVYFSRTGEQYEVGEITKGNTAIVADMIIEQTGADSFELKPVVDNYPTTYDELTDVAKQEQEENARPKYAGSVPDLSKYDTVFIGSPVWWNDYPMIVYTFLEENADNLAGKTLFPFSTHAGSGLAGFEGKLRETCPNSTIGKGLAVNGADAQNRQDKVQRDVNDWLSGLGF